MLSTSAPAQHRASLELYKHSKHPRSQSSAPGGCDILCCISIVATPPPIRAATGLPNTAPAQHSSPQCPPPWYSILQSLHCSVLPSGLRYQWLHCSGAHLASKDCNSWRRIARLCFMTGSCRTHVHASAWLMHKRSTSLVDHEQTWLVVFARVSNGRKHGQEAANARSLKLLKPDFTSHAAV